VSSVIASVSDGVRYANLRLGALTSFVVAGGVAKDVLQDAVETQHEDTTRRHNTGYAPTVFANAMMISEKENNSTSY